MEFLFIAEAGELERQALLLAESIRKFGGRYARARATALQPRAERRISEEGRRRFEALDVKVVELDVVSPCPAYGTSFRIFACAEYERIATAECLIFLDSDTVLLAEPDFELEGADVAARPVDVKGMCTTGDGDGNEPYWRELCRVCEVDCASLPFVTSTVDRARVRASFNGGLTVVKTKAGLFAKTADFFVRSMEAKLVPWPERVASVSAGHGEVAVEGARLWGSAQACLSVAITALRLSVRTLPASVNFPLHFHAELTPDILAGRVPAITHLHYHHFFREAQPVNPLFAGMEGCPPEAVEWLRMHRGANPHAGKRLVLVLGMHRSGTSALTKGLEALGVELAGDLMAADAENPKGYWEDMAFFRFNEELLGELDRGWADIGFLNTQAVRSLGEGAWFSRAWELLGSRFSGRELIGLKDPRFCLLLPFWEKVFAAAGIVVSRVVAIRDPRSVAASLLRRDGLPEAGGLWLWWLYNAQLVATTREPPCVVVDYDELLDAPRAQLARMARALALPIDGPKLAAFSDEFIDASLRHARHTMTGEPAGEGEHPAFATYAALKSLARSHSVSREQWRGLSASWSAALGAGGALLEIVGGLSAETRRLKREHDALLRRADDVLREEIARRELLEAVLREQAANYARLEASHALLEARIARIRNSFGWKLYTPFLFAWKRLAALGGKNAAPAPGAIPRIDHK